MKPSEFSTDNYSVLPIGGVDEIGSNMTLIRGLTEDIVIDCGLLFPYEDCFDINYLIPDFSQLDPERFKNIIITHGHEDHIGALSHLLEKFPSTTVYASPFTLKLIQLKLEAKNINLRYQIYRPGQEISFSDVDIIPVHVNHSIPETAGLIIRTKTKSFGSLYISDFKVDLTAEHEAPIDFPLIKEKLSECKETAYFMDSTNIIFDGKTVSEKKLYPDLEFLINGDERRVFITLFASNIHRMNAIINMGKKANRKIVVMGRSLWTYMQAAQNSQHTDVAIEDLLLPDQVKGDTNKVLVFLSGCQGDFLSALRRFSFGEDSNFKPTSEDLVIFSSKVIPGNEKKIYRIYNKLTQFGAKIITAYDYEIHASGHPGKEDLRLLLQNFTPDYYFPIHGESYMLRKHYEFIQREYPQIKTHVIHNYNEVLFKPKKIKITEHPVIEPHLIHGKGLEIEKTQISQRRKMATQGAVFITYIKKQDSLEVSFIGLPLSAQDSMDKLKSKLSHLINEQLINRDPQYFKDQLKISTRQFLNNLLGYKPVTEVHLF